MLSLSALASWESVILASIQGASGTIEERDAQITRSGMYAEYPAIFATYLELASIADDRQAALEALKRAVFLAWWAFVEPSVFSGISELPESDVRAVMQLVNHAIAAGETDDELRCMLVWYYEKFDEVFELFGPVRLLEPFIADLSLDDVKRRAPEFRGFAGRGQMGDYWRRALEREIG